jgi:hypothetical protein
MRLEAGKCLLLFNRNSTHYQFVRSTLLVEQDKGNKIFPFWHTDAELASRLSELVRLRSIIIHIICANDRASSR